jgi:hypothetical protein
VTTDRIADLLDLPPAPLPARPDASAPTPEARSSGHARRTPPRWAVPVVAAVFALAAGVWIGRVTAPTTAAPASPPAARDISTAANWLPDCNATPGPKCDVEVRTRQFMRDWQNGADVSGYMAPGEKVPGRSPRGPISQIANISASETSATVVVWTDADGKFVIGFRRFDGVWRIDMLEG